jgi:hypothetical protein
MQYLCKQHIHTVPQCPAYIQSHPIISKEWLPTLEDCGKALEFSHKLQIELKKPPSPTLTAMIKIRVKTNAIGDKSISPIKRMAFRVFVMQNPNPICVFVAQSDTVYSVISICCKVFNCSTESFSFQ